MTTTKFTGVSAGYAEITNVETGRRIGRVERLDPHMVVSGTTWRAYSNGRTVGSGETRGEAAAYVVRDFDARMAARAAFLAEATR
jgi:hypothetical protein